MVHDEIMSALIKDRTRRLRREAKAARRAAKVRGR